MAHTVMTENGSRMTGFDNIIRENINGYVKKNDSMAVTASYPMIIEQENDSYIHNVIVRGVSMDRRANDSTGVTSSTDMYMGNSTPVHTRTVSISTGTTTKALANGLMATIDIRVFLIGEISGIFIFVKEND